LNKFWPHRPSVRGFSIEKLAEKYRDKVYKPATDDLEESNIEKELINNNKLSSITYIHWANRDFNEYQEVA
tara:strand:- start:1849 stop:2061 length:213 start_codon:yes stop_codon:yes gene_type:complete